MGYLFFNIMSFTSAFNLSLLNPSPLLIFILPYNYKFSHLFRIPYFYFIISPVISFHLQFIIPNLHTSVIYSVKLFVPPASKITNFSTNWFSTVLISPGYSHHRNNDFILWTLTIHVPLHCHSSFLISRSFVICKICLALLHHIQNSCSYSRIHLYPDSPPFQINPVHTVLPY